VATWLYPEPQRAVSGERPLRIDGFFLVGPKETGMAICQNIFQQIFCLSMKICSAAKDNGAAESLAETLKNNLAYVTARGGVRAILEHLGLPTSRASLAKAQGPAQRACC
jgi:hypothetical protein